jgi:hypothetical protein
MDKLGFAERLGKKIIESQHAFFEADSSEDLEYILNIKRIIVAISDYLRSDGLPEDGINALTSNLRQFCRSMYLDSCVSQKDADEDERGVKSESEIWFDFIYKHEKYPR